MQEKGTRKFVVWFYVVRLATLLSFSFRCSVPLQIRCIGSEAASICILPNRNSASFHPIGEKDCDMLDVALLLIGQSIGSLLRSI